jgi:hypothetical protein
MKGLPAPAEWLSALSGSANAQEFSNVTIYPHRPVDELWITFSQAKFTGKQLIHIIHKSLWMTCA